MIGDFITRILVLVLGYAYPAFQCFKTVEKNRVEIPELRFWCQYWIIVAVITVLEKIGDVFVSWIPMYGEMKLALFIYLWYPKTNGTGYIYETFLRPIVTRHETDIDRSLLEFRERAWNLAIYYWHNCTELGSTKILQLLQFVASQSGRGTQQPTSENTKNQQQQQQQQQHNKKAPPHVLPPPPPPSTPSTTFQRTNSDKWRPPLSPSSAPSSSHFSHDSNTKVHLHNETQFIHPENVLIPEHQSNKKGKEFDIEEDLHAARLRLRRFIDGK